MVQVIMVCLILLSYFDRSFLVSVIGDWRFLDHWFASSVLGLHTREGGPVLFIYLLGLGLFFSRDEKGGLDRGIHLGGVRIETETWGLRIQGRGLKLTCCGASGALNGGRGTATYHSDLCGLL